MKEEHNCIKDSQDVLKAKTWKLGEIFTCPTCSKRWLRVYVENDRYIAVWASLD